MAEVYVVAARSGQPCGQAGAGAGAEALAATLTAAGLSPRALDALFVASAGAPTPEGLAPQVGLLAGAPVGLRAVGLSGCGLEALQAAAQAIASGYAEVSVAVGIQLSPATGGSPLLPLESPLDWRLAPADAEEGEARAAQRLGVGPEALLPLRERLARRSPGGGLPERAADRAGASAALLLSAEALAAHRLQPLARVVSLGARAADPALWPSAAAAAAQDALGRLGFTAADIAAWALDERSVLGLAAAIAALEVPPHRVNRALDTLRAGHMGAAEGPRRLGGLIDELGQLDARFGALALASPTGQGRALVLDREFYL